MRKYKITPHNTVHIAGRGSVVRQLRILASQFRVLRTGTLSEIRPDNMYQPLCGIQKRANAQSKECYRTHCFFANALTKTT